MAFAFALPILAALACLGCNRSGLPQIRVASSRELGVLTFIDPVVARDGGYSAVFDGRSVWVFGDTILSRPGEDGEAWRSSTWSQTSDLDASDGLADFSEPLDSAGAPHEFLRFTSDELAYNRAHRGNDCKSDCGARWALWPGPLVVDPDEGDAIVFYSKIDARPGAFNFESLGASVATWKLPGQTPERPIVRPDTEEPTLLFQGDEPRMVSGALLRGDILYVYGCDTEGPRCPCRLGRVTMDSAPDRDAWEFYAGGDDWSADWREAAVVFHGAPMLTVHWNRHLDAYLAVYSQPLESTVAARVSGQPQGPWSEGVAIHSGEPPSDPELWSYSGLAHPELARENGKVEYITYYRPGSALEGEMRLVEVVFQ